MTPSKVLHISELHLSDTAQASAFGDRPGFMRDTLSGVRRYTEAVTTAVSESVDLFINGCDTVASNCTDLAKLGLFTDFLDYLDANLGGIKSAHALGNHLYRLAVAYEWDGVDGAPTMAQYFTALNASTSEVVKSNAFGEDFGGGDEAFSYTFTDTNGLLWICVCCPYGSTMTDRDANDHLDWLNDRLQAANSAGTPCVVLSHTQLWQNDASPTPITLRINDTDWASLQTIYDNAGTLQCVLGGHSHAAGQFMKWHDIWFIDVAASVSMPPYFGVAESDTGNAYVVITIDPQVFATPYGLKANILVTGYGFNTFSKAYENFFIGTS